MSLIIRLEAEAGRFVAEVDGHDCLLEFRRQGDRVIMSSVRVPKAVGGRGIAGQLTRHALDWARSEDLQVEPLCPYVKSWIDRHPDY